MTLTLSMSMLLYQWYSLQQRQRQQQSRAKLKVNEIPLHRVCPYDRLKWHLLQYGSAILVTHTHTVSFRWRINGNISAHTHTHILVRAHARVLSQSFLLLSTTYTFCDHTQCAIMSYTFLPLSLSPSFLHFTNSDSRISLFRWQIWFSCA